MQESITALYVQPSSLFGGAERQAATNVPLLPAFGVNVIPLVGPGRIIADWLEERGVAHAVHAPQFPGSWRKHLGVMRALLPARYAACVIRSAAQVDRILRERRVDVILAAMPFSWVATTRVARRHGIPIVWRCGGTEIKRWEMLLLGAFARLYPPDLLLCCSSAVERKITTFISAPSRIVLNGVDLEHFQRNAGDAERYRPPGARIVVGFAGRLVPQKRPQDFLAMAARIAPRHPEVTFLVAGEGSLRASFMDQAQRLGLGRRLEFLGYVADMRSFYAACDVFVLPSRSEGCPNVVLEALAAKRALVVSDAAGTREIIRDGVDGLVHRIGDVDSLTRAVERLVVDERLRADLARAGHARVASGFSANACAREIAGILRTFAATARERARRAAPAGKRIAPRAAPTPTPPPAAAVDSHRPDTPLAARRGTG